MQIRLTVLAPHAGHADHGAGRTCDVLVTAPAGTELAAVAAALATAVSGPETPSSHATVLYAGGERLDTRRCLLGEPPLVDGGVLSLHVPGPPGPDEHVGEKAPARLHVVAGPDAGGVHLLHGGAIVIGRSVDADVPLDDPDVSRTHCTVTVSPDGRVTVADPGSTNGTTLDGTPVGARPVRFAPGAVLRVGESALRLTTGPAGGPEDTLATVSDGEGHLRVAHAGTLAGPGSASGTNGPNGPRNGGPSTTGGTAVTPLGQSYEPFGGARTASSETPTHGGNRRLDGTAAANEDGTGTGTGNRNGNGEWDTDRDGHARVAEPGESHAESPGDSHGDSHGGFEHHGRTRQTRKRGIGAWARRFAGGREEPEAEYGVTPVPAFPEGLAGGTGGPGRAPADSWPDPAAVLLTALGPGPRLWERGLDHPEALVVRLGTTDRAELSGVPVTVGLREAGALGLAGPTARLDGLARSVVAQLAALHSPGDLEIVLVSADRGRPLEERRRNWGWLGWLPHTRPAHGQDCRLLLAYDRDQAHARLTELTRRLDGGPLGTGWASADRAAIAEAAARHTGPVTVVVVDGDPGSAALRETAARLAVAGAAVGIHLIALAEAPSASPASPVAATYETACATSLAFRECGAAALLSGDVATALRLLRTAGGRVAGHGTVGVLDAVSVAWAERFGRALAPLRPDTAGADGGRTAAALPPSSRLLDELGLARATPASLMARWASAPEGTAVLGAGPHGPAAVDLTKEGPHLLIEGPAGSGRTELLRSIAASLAAGGRPDRLGLLLVDGAGGGRGEGLAVCTELPHVTEHLVASDPVRMREFAQALNAELKRRAELLGDTDFADRRSAGRLVGQRAPSPAESLPSAAPASSPSSSSSALASVSSGSSVPSGSSGSSVPGASALTSSASRATARIPEARSGDSRTGGAAGSLGGAAVLGDTPSGRLPRAGAADLHERPSSRTYRTGGDGVGGLGDTPSGRLARPSADLYDQASARTYRTGGDSGGALGDTPSTRLARSSGGSAAPGAGAGASANTGVGAGAGSPADGAGTLPRLVVIVDDYDALVAPALGAPGRPAAGSVMRALEAVARGGARLGIHLVAASAQPDRTSDTELAHGARLRIVLDPPPAAPDGGPDGPQPGRGRLGHPDGRVTPFQTGRVTGRIPRTATQRPTVVPVEWERMGDPPARRPIRELGNGPTDLALLASALDRAARSVEATPIPPLTSPAPA
ncbi:FtsK/SpoIIIE domain-containing protein [Streptomyces sp. NPDC046203]|uniref:FtsK/SpoIIIE domain-containing protein n=1 Tax=Streptomyces sp. NPDC046203 TaxID=3154602 RepID=UPI003407B900